MKLSELAERLGAVLEGDKTISAITKANPGVVTASSHGYSDGDFVVISSVAGMTQVNGKTFKVSNKTTNIRFSPHHHRQAGPLDNG